MHDQCKRGFQIWQRLRAYTYVYYIFLLSGNLNGTNIRPQDSKVHTVAESRRKTVNTSAYNRKPACPNVDWGKRYAVREMCDKFNVLEYISNETHRRDMWESDAARDAVMRAVCEPPLSLHTYAAILLASSSVHEKFALCDIICLGNDWQSETFASG